jgi:hypothetical protein
VVNQPEFESQYLAKNRHGTHNLRVRLMGESCTFRNLGPAASVRYLVLVLLPMFLRRNFKQDRRRRTRQLFNTSVRVFTKSACMEALGVNISEVGMCLFTIANLPLGSQIQVELLPPRCTRPMRVCATVRHRAFYLYGIEFLADSDQSPVDDLDGQGRQESTLASQS